jgi:hypothetical protein
MIELGFWGLARWRRGEAVGASPWPRVASRQWVGLEEEAVWREANAGKESSARGRSYQAARGRSREEGSCIPLSRDRSRGREVLDDFLDMR